MLSIRLSFIPNVDGEPVANQAQKEEINRLFSYCESQVAHFPLICH